MSQNVTVFGRIVQGGIELRDKIDQQTKLPQMKDGVKVQECYIGLAVAKGSPDFNALYSAMHAEARAGHPTLFDANGNCVRQDYAWKMIDGDGRDPEGKLYSEREGFAGHYVFKLQSRFLPKCYPSGQFAPSMEIQDAHKFVKRGHWVNVAINVSSNGVTPGGQAKAGLYLSPDKIEHVAIDKEIGGGISAEEAFANRPRPQLPPGVQAIGPGAYAQPQGGQGLPPPPGQPQQFVQQPAPRQLVLRADLAGQGYTLDGLRSQGNTDDAIVAQGWASWQ